MFGASPRLSGRTNSGFAVRSRLTGEIICRQLIMLADEAKANHFLTACRALGQDVAAQLGRQGLKLEAGICSSPPPPV